MQRRLFSLATETADVLPYNTLLAALLIETADLSYYNINRKTNSLKT